ncbi:SCO family protein [Pseudoduganella buxea]|uniref:SCO family protein n=1 Tax=Pseudoduganella buxea TaxID=1949069 RepID=A0A6I3SUS5_9BURK|nr:SCO family protein [Pseudoduganella buxea]MTV52910.1 SCO family protein [Pseudoduganella buxea]GGC16490.1 hypothetical protein GCM10011572_42280 [Pseudoduganella buxea]
MLGVLACLGPLDAMAAGPPRQQFTAPAPGSYRLETIQPAADGEVLDAEGTAGPLRRYTTGKVTLLSFMYTYCVDPVGCPLVFDTFSTLRTRLLANPALARRVRLVSLSFDPGNDTPAALRHYAGNLAAPTSALRWHFLTTRNVARLRPIVDAFGQDVTVTLDAQGRPTRLYNHLVKVFLIDARGQVREIYTTAYLMPDVIYNDIRTLLMEGGRQGGGPHG